MGQLIKSYKALLHKSLRTRLQNNADFFILIWLNIDKAVLSLSESKNIVLYDPAQHRK